MTAPNIPLKFVKSMVASGSLSTTETGRFFIKLLYEFWGFCVNGNDSSLLIPGGFAAVSGVLAPPGFESGSTVLWAQGRDGKTDFGTDIFHSDSINFINLDLASASRGQLIGKYLVTWKGESDSTDDGVYPIMGIVDANTIRVQTEVGATRRVGNKAFFRKREAINFRVVDILAASKLSSWTDGAGLVLQLNRAADVNPGQANSQVKVSLHNTQQNVGIIVSPSGSWSGTTFTDGTPELSANWFNQAGTFNQWVLIGGRDCLLVNHHPIDNASAQSSSGMHIEIPKRLYTGSLDPNPIAFNIWAQLSPSGLNGVYNNFRMVCEDNGMRSMVTMPRAAWGTHIDTAVTAVSGGLWQGFTNSTQSGRYANMTYNMFTDTFITSDAILGSNNTGHFNLARCRLRRLRFTTSQFYNRFRFGDLGWVHVANGILWPWDNSMQAFGIQPEGI